MATSSTNSSYNPSPVYSVLDLGYGKNLIKEDSFYADVAQTASSVDAKVNPLVVGSGFTSGNVQMVNGSLSSPDFKTGVSGWQLTSDTAEFNNIVARGNITALTGLIGGWTINSTYLAKDTGVNSSSAGMSPIDWPFWAGATYANRATAPVRVSTAGILYASGAVISGYVPSGGAAADVNANVTTISGGKITALSVTAAQIAASTITADKLSVTSLSAISASLGTVTSGSIYGAFIATSSNITIDRVEISAGPGWITSYTGTQYRIKHGVSSIEFWASDGSNYAYLTSVPGLGAGQGFNVVCPVITLDASTQAQCSNNFVVGHDLSVTRDAYVGRNLSVTGTSSFTGHIQAGNIDCTNLGVSAGFYVADLYVDSIHPKTGTAIGIYGDVTLLTGHVSAAYFVGNAFYGPVGDSSNKYSLHGTIASCPIPIPERSGLEILNELRPIYLKQGEENAYYGEGQYWREIDAPEEMTMDMGKSGAGYPEFEVQKQLSVCIKAIKELAEENKELRQEIISLKKQLNIV